MKKTTTKPSSDKKSVTISEGEVERQHMSESAEDQATPSTPQLGIGVPRLTPSNDELMGKMRKKKPRISRVQKLQKSYYNKAERKLKSLDPILYDFMKAKKKVVKVSDDIEKVCTELVNYVNSLDLDAKEGVFKLGKSHLTYMTDRMLLITSKVKKMTETSTQIENIALRERETLENAKRERDKINTKLFEMAQKSFSYCPVEQTNTAMSGFFLQK